MFLALALLVSLPCHASGRSEDPAVACVNRAAGAEAVVRVDEARKRLFIVKKDGGEAGLTKLVRAAEPCFDSHAWKDDWALSVFSAKRYAGYMDEPQITPLHRNNEWAKAYRAEYDAKTRKLTLTPAASSKEIVLPKSR